MGNTTLFQPNGAEWKAKRKSLSAVFYKKKLIKMIDIIKHQCDTQMARWKAEFADKGEKMDLVAEMSGLMEGIILNSAFGVDISKDLLDYTDPDTGVVYKWPIGKIMRSVFISFFVRMKQPHLFLFPELISWFIFPNERII